MSARVLNPENSQADDVRGRSTKKVKTKEGDEGDGSGKEIVMLDTVPTPPSYKDRLLSVDGVGGYEDFMLEDWANMELPEDRWYKEPEEDHGHDQGRRTRAQLCRCRGKSTRAGAIDGRCPL